MRPLFLFILTLTISILAAAEVPLYKMDFEETEVGEVPDDFLVLEGEFAVEETEDGNKVLVLPGQPVSTFTTLLGPAEIEGNAIRARIKAEAQKRRFSSFAVGLNGISGYRLQINPTRRLLEFYREDTLEASSEYRWKSGEWTHLKMQVRKLDDGKWRIEGKAWKEEEEEPSEWSIVYKEMEEPHTGRPSIWGIPYAEKPIWFDDVLITRAAQ
jgi:hypothetical protein